LLSLAHSTVKLIIVLGVTSLFLGPQVFFSDVHDCDPGKLLSLYADFGEYLSSTKKRGQKCVGKVNC